MTDHPTTPATALHNPDEDGWCQNPDCDWNSWNAKSDPPCPVDFGGKKAGTIGEQEDMLAETTINRTNRVNIQDYKEPTTPNTDNSEVEQVKQEMWSHMPSCECCSSGQYQCTAEEPCEHCSTFLDYIVDLQAKSLMNMRPLVALKNGNGEIDGNWYVMYWDDHEQLWNRARLENIISEARKRYVSDDCKTCSGTGMEICNNPDHNFIDGALQFTDYGRLGCPLCGHDEKYRIPNTKCSDCNGTGKEKLYTAIEIAQAVAEARLDEHEKIKEATDKAYEDAVNEGYANALPYFDDWRATRYIELQAQLNPQKPEEEEV